MTVRKILVFTYHVIKWGIGIFFLVSGLVFLTESILATIIFFLLSVITVPYTSKVIFSKIKYDVPRWGKYSIAIGLFILVMIVVPESKNTNPVAENNESISEALQVANSNEENQQLDSSEIGSTQAEASEPTTEPTSEQIPQPDKYKVVSVTDGDTFKVSIDGKTETVRIVGIDTPETEDPRKSVECYGKEAGNQLKSLLTGKSVSLENDEQQGDKDRYSRLLRFVFLDGQDIGLKMIQDGYAQESLYTSTPHIYHDSYVKAEEEAKNNKKGMWAADACPLPTTTPTSKPVSVTGGKTGNSGSSVAPAPAEGGSWGCDCSKPCAQMSSCAEAQYQLNTCGCTRRDGDSDGVACDSDCQ